MRDAIVFSTWDWQTFNVPERIALALASRGSRVLYCEMPVSRLRRRHRPFAEIAKGVHRFAPEYFGGKLNLLPLARNFQWKSVAQQILAKANELQLREPVFLYSHVKHMMPLCREMRAKGLPLVHICMDYPEAYQYELIAASNRTLVIPQAVFHKLKAKYGEKIERIPQSIYLPRESRRANGPEAEPPELSRIPHPRLGYLGPIVARVNLALLKETLAKNPEWHFICFGDASALPLPNVHSLAWRRPAELPAFAASLDAGVMPYDCFAEKNLHCAPLKLFDYFLAGLPVVSTPVISVWEFSDLIYFGETAPEFSQAIRAALDESPESEKRRRRTEIARAHSTEALGQCLEEILNLKA